MGFYCENCGEKVERECEECPSCGVLFKAVKCPSCGFSGSSGAFGKGCPSCGYLSPDQTQKKRISAQKKRKELFRNIPDRFFWITGILLLFLIPVLIYLLLQ